MRGGHLLLLQVADDHGKAVCCRVASRLSRGCLANRSNTRPRLAHLHAVRTLQRVACSKVFGARCVGLTCAQQWLSLDRHKRSQPLRLKLSCRSTNRSRMESFDFFLLKLSIAGKESEGKTYDNVGSTLGAGCRTGDACVTLRSGE